MKKIALLLSVVLLVGCTGRLSAQTFSEFFRQKKTQKKYLLQQIAALQVYTLLAKKGYAVVSGGLHLIGDIKNGKFNLDKDYFQGLNTATRILQATDKPAACQQLYLSIRQLYAKADRRLTSSYLTVEEKKYIHQV